MKLKKKRKSIRMRGTRYHGWAAKKHKGSGNRGGKGMAGTGKRAGQKITYVKKYFPDYFGKEGLKRKKENLKTKTINLSGIEKNIESYKNSRGEIELKNYKILGDGEAKDKLIIKAKAFSKKAKEKIEKAGGKAIRFYEKVEDKKDSKPAKSEKEKTENK